MRTRTLAHLSDLHFGLPALERAATDLCRALLVRAVDHVVVTGDITHRGRRAELERFRALFAPLLESGRLTLVPGNHDRWNDDVSSELQPGRRVQIGEAPGLHLVRVDSSGPHNRSLFLSYGSLDEPTIEDIARAFEPAGPGCLRVLLLHHHLLPQPEESLPERLAALLGWPDVGELDLGHVLLERLRGRCDLVLHGHRHVPCELTLFADEARPLGIYNAGSSTELGRARLFAHADGRLARAPFWLDARLARAAA